MRMQITYDIAPGGSAWARSQTKEYINLADFGPTLAKAQRNLADAEDRVRALSDALYGASYGDTSVKRRARMRVDLDRACANRDTALSRRDALLDLSHEIADGT